ncbi:MAG: hypothetical protein ACRCZS_06695 [Chroococcidiopsis sp.]
MTPEEKLQRSSAIARFSQSQNKRTKLYKRIPDTIATVIGYNAEVGANVIQLLDGSISHAQSDTNGAMAIGETVPLHQGTGNIDGLPNIPARIVPKVRLSVKKVGLVKVLFSTNVRINDIQVKYSFYITGDKFGTRKIAEFITDSYAPFGNDYPYVSMNTTFNNLGEGKNDFIFTALVGTTIYPGFLAPIRSGNVFFIQNKSEPLRVYSSAELTTLLLNTNLVDLGAALLGAYKDLTFFVYDRRIFGSDSEITLVNFFETDILIPTSFRYKNSDDFTYVLPSEDFKVDNPPPTEIGQQTYKKIFSNDLSNRVIVAATEASYSVDLQEAYLIENISGVKKSLKVNNAELLPLYSYYNWTKNQIFTATFSNYGALKNGENKIDITSLTLTEVDNEINVTSRITSQKVKLTNVPFDDESLNIISASYLPN